jgi:aminoglycoside 6'-N-acetyltransferase I
MIDIIIRRLQPEDKPEWLRMRHLLWPGHSEAEMLAEMNETLSNPEEQPVFVAARPDGRLGGFLEGGTRKYADGCESSPVGYLEGWYVDEDQRQKGAGGRLVQAMEAWARARGLTEMASDTWLENEISIAAHGRLGYMEMERLVHFAKKL